MKDSAQEKKREPWWAGHGFFLLALPFIGVAIWTESDGVKVACLGVALVLLWAQRTVDEVDHQ